MQQYKTFQNGTTWLKADFHLHSRADGEFSCSNKSLEYPPGNTFPGYKLAQNEPLKVEECSKQLSLETKV